eukprot:m.237081 g.237081  ORF g.237081 m.237081 type:complete len:59 (-) comp18949_c0_seq9:112-288(-)
MSQFCVMNTFLGFVARFQDLKIKDGGRGCRATSCVVFVMAECTQQVGWESCTQDQSTS